MTQVNWAYLRLLTPLYGGGFWRIQVVEVFLKNQHPPRLIFLGDTAKTCRFRRGSLPP